jgi:hypothetical protein
MAITLELWRSGWVVEHDGVTGEISEVWNGNDLVCWALERNTKGWTRLDERADPYPIKMEISPTYGRKQFRVLGHNKHGGYAPILIHAANYPGELEGCIGPGLVPTEDGVDKSELAMQALFALFGGFKAGTEGALRITSG